MIEKELFVIGIAVLVIGAFLATLATIVRTFNRRRRVGILIGIAVMLFWGGSAFVWWCVFTNTTPPPILMISLPGLGVMSFAASMIAAKLKKW